VNDDYTQTIVGREARDYVWIMARTPAISEQDYQALVAMIAREGYDVAQLQKVPHRDAE
jgi:apolipoprotein D and lipocalin family protein